MAKFIQVNQFHLINFDLVSEIILSHNEKGDANALLINLKNGKSTNITLNSIDDYNNKFSYLITLLTK